MTSNAAVLGKKSVSVPKVIFLQVAEFNGELVRPKNYENGHKSIFWPFSHFRIEG